MHDGWECSLDTHQTASVSDTYKSGIGTGTRIALFPAEDEFKGPEKTDTRKEAGFKIEIPRQPGTWSRV